VKKVSGVAHSLAWLTRLSNTLDIIRATSVKYKALLIVTTTSLA
jgi:hypothetical protein